MGSLGARLSETAELLRSGGHLEAPIDQTGIVWEAYHNGSHYWGSLELPLNSYFLDCFSLVDFLDL